MTDQSEPVIRPLQADEAEAFRELRLRALREAPDAYGTQYEAAVLATVEEWAQRYGPSSATGQMFVAGERGALVACARSSLDGARPSFGHVTAMWVNPEQRRSGVALALLEACERWARDRGRTEMALDVGATSTAARRLYERAGYRATGEIDALRPGSSISVERMVKLLD